VSNLIYITSRKLPSMEANSVNSLKMCNSFLKLGLSVNIFCDLANFNQSIFKSKYGVSEKLRFNNSRLFPKTSFRMINFTSRLTSDFFLSYNLNRDKRNFIFSRNIFSLLMLKHVRFSLELHKPPNSFFEKIIFRLIGERSNCSKIICISNSLKNIIIKDNPNLPKNKILVCHDGAEKFKGDKLSRKNRKMRVAYAGSLYKGRGLSIIKKMAEKFRNTNFVVIGGEKNEFNYEHANILHIPFVAHSKVSSLLNQCDVLLAPYQKALTIRNQKNSSSHLWMSPLKVFEYMSIGKPIICSNFKVINEVLRDGYNSILVNPSNVVDWLNALQTLKGNEKLMDQLGKNAKGDFEANYTWYKRAERIIKECKISS